MWRTGIGNRVLRGAEWRFFRAGLSHLWWQIEGLWDDECTEVGVAVFDTLQPGQKLAALANVGRALSDKLMPCPDHTAVLEGAIAAVFETLRDLILTEVEIQIHEPDYPVITEVRQLALDAGKTLRDWELPRLLSKKEDDWTDLVECLMDRVFWDRDWEMADGFLDADPGLTGQLLEALGIDREYYTDTPMDAEDEWLEAVRRTLREVCGRPKFRRSRRMEIEEATDDDASLIDGFEDIYNQLFVGPCTEEQLASVEPARLVSGIGVTSADQFDCTFEEWQELFGRDTLRASKIPAPTTEAMIKLLDKRQRQKAKDAAKSGEPIWAGGETKILRRGGGWIAVNKFGDYLVELNVNSWASGPEDPDMPAIRYPTPLEMYAAYLWANSTWEAAGKRNDVALERLELQRLELAGSI